MTLVSIGSSLTGSKRCSDSPSCADFCGHFGQSGAFCQALGAVEVCAEVSIAEREPVESSVAPQRGHRLETLVDEAPASFWVDRLGERVGAGVEIRTDA